MRKRFYILFVARDAEGQLRKIPIPIHYLYVFLAGAVIGMSTITGMAGSYTRMLLKVASFNQLRTEKKALQTKYSQLEKATHEKDIQVASLGSIANEVSVIYGLKPNPKFLTDDDKPLDQKEVADAINSLYALRTSALTGATAAGVNMGLNHRASLSDWVAATNAPTLWPVMGPITGAFGARIDPFNGEGAFHSGVDISCHYGQPILAPADGVVTYADFYSGYGRLLEIDHGNSIVTRYGHLSGFAVADGQSVRKGQVIGYVGMSGRSTGAHLHYEVRIHDTPVNPHKYLRAVATSAFGAGG
ncbi:MAG TPA: M23 family metallopeptidase [Candidatus Eisenbacteria bacterium]|nr:M23 family metallopeptidase [Candidatus Eisenbacteria bacterium]